MNPWHFLFRPGPGGAAAPALPLASTLALALLLSLAVNCWKLFHLRYTFGEAALLFAIDLPLLSLLVLTARVNPLQFAPVYTLLYLAFGIGFLVSSPPRGSWEWFGSLVALGLVWLLFPLLHVLTAPVVIGVTLAFLIVQVALPMDYRSDALSRMKETNRMFAGRDFLASVADNRRHFLGREKFRWYLAEPSAERLASVRKLHRAVWRRMNALRVRNLEWDGVRVVSTALGDGTIRVRYGGVAAGTLGKEKDRPAGGVPAPNTRFPNLPNVAVLVGPVEVTVARGPDGLWRVTELPEDVPLALAPDPASRPAPQGAAAGKR